MNDRDIKNLRDLLEDLIDSRIFLKKEIEDLQNVRDKWKEYAEELEATLQDIQEEGL